MEELPDSAQNQEDNTSILTGGKMVLDFFFLL